MNYIKRDLEDNILSLSEEYSCLLITGPRQVGKTTVLRRLMTPERNYVTLDDLEERRMAKNDPALFLQVHDIPIFIDDERVIIRTKLEKPSKIKGLALI